MSKCRVLDTFEFKDGTKCKLLAFYKPGDYMVNGCTVMLPRGRADKASMDEAAFQKFWKNRAAVPRKWWDEVIVFPETPDSDGYVRYARRRIRGGWSHGRGKLDDGWSCRCGLVQLS